MRRTVLLLNQEWCQNCSVPVLNAHSPWAVSALWRFLVVERTGTQQSVSGIHPHVPVAFMLWGKRAKWWKSPGKHKSIFSSHGCLALISAHFLGDLTWYLSLFSHYQLQHLHHIPSLTGQPSTLQAQLICSQPLSSTYPLSWQLKPASFMGLHTMGKIYLDLHDIPITPIYFYWLKIISKIKTIKLIRKSSYLTQNMNRIPIRKKFN